MLSGYFDATNFAICALRPRGVHKITRATPEGIAPIILI